MFNEKYTKIIEIAKKFNGEVGKEIDEMLSNLTYKQKIKVLNGENFSRTGKNKDLSFTNYGRTYSNTKEVEFEESFLELETDKKAWRLELVNFSKEWVDQIANIDENDTATDIFTLTVYNFDQNHEWKKIVEHTIDVNKNEEGYYLTYSFTDEDMKFEQEILQYNPNTPTRNTLINAMIDKPKLRGYDVVTHEELDGTSHEIHDYHEINREDYKLAVRKISKNQLYKIADLPCNLKFGESEEEFENDVD